MRAPLALQALLLCRLGLSCELAWPPAPSGLEDSLVLVQQSAGGQARHKLRRRVNISDAVADTPEGPVVVTQDGPILGVLEGSVLIFKRIPYAETPVRFERPVPRRPWAPSRLNGTQYGPGCIGSHTDVAESEDCLFLNIWVPKGGRKNMPVMVYFHGGLNQHGSGQEKSRQGDGITRSAKYPTIFINFDFRLGMLGWIDGHGGRNVTPNLGFLDQQQALRWVHRNIAAFGGDPGRVTLDGQSEGASIIMTHLVSPGSSGLFQRAIFHSPPADMWSREVNKLRTEFMIKRLNCTNQDPEEVMNCLRNVSVSKLWNADWIAEELARNPFSPQWMGNLFGMLKFGLGKDLIKMPTYLGWHPVVDGDQVPGEPRELIMQGKWNKAEILLTVSKNETWGVFPGGPQTLPTLRLALATLSGRVDLGRITDGYTASLNRSGVFIKDPTYLAHMMLTDKMWTCDIRSLAADINAGGGQAYVSMFWHSPKFDPIGTSTNKICDQGATCHAAEMMYAIPQGRHVGVHGPGMEDEIAFVKKYRDAILSFVHGDDQQLPFAKYSTDDQAMTFFDKDGPRVLKGYRREQCAVLDSSMGEDLPMFMRVRNRKFGGLELAA